MSKNKKDNTASFSILLSQEEDDKMGYLLLEWGLFKKTEVFRKMLRIMHDQQKNGLLTEYLLKIGD